VDTYGMFYDRGQPAAGAFCSPPAIVPGHRAVGLVLSAIIIAVLYWYFGTEQGSAIRATGNNPAMSRAQGINIDSMKVLGLAISNAMVALSGGLMGQFQGYADINMGRGSIVIGLAAVIIGEVLCDAVFRKGANFAVRLGFIVLGGVVYYLVVVHRAVDEAAHQRPQALHRRGGGRVPGGAVPAARRPAVPSARAGQRREERRSPCLTSITSPRRSTRHHQRKAGPHRPEPAPDEGDFVTVIGGNGAGKSTMLNAVAGVWPVDEGRILIDGSDVTGLPEYRRSPPISAGCFRTP
jgi:hypothetical protein